MKNSASVTFLCQTEHIVIKLLLQPLLCTRQRVYYICVFQRSMQANRNITLCQKKTPVYKLSRSKVLKTQQICHYKHATKTSGPLLLYSTGVDFSSRNNFANLSSFAKAFVPVQSIVPCCLVISNKQLFPLGIFCFFHVNLMCIMCIHCQQNVWCNLDIPTAICLKRFSKLEETLTCAMQS